MANTLNDELVEAARQGHVEQVVSLLEQGADATYNYGASYVLAVANNRFEVVDVLYPLVDEDAHLIALEIASINNLPDMVDYIYQHDHGQRALNSMLNGPNGDMGTKLLQQRLTGPQGGNAISEVKRRTLKR